MAIQQRIIARRKHMGYHIYQNIAVFRLHQGWLGYVEMAICKSMKF